MDERTTYSVTMRHTGVTIVSVEKQYHILSISYPAWKALPPCYTIKCGLWLYHIFPHFLINGMIFGGKSY
jgi:hypothetical protein